MTIDVRDPGHIGGVEGSFGRLAVGDEPVHGDRVIGGSHEWQVLRIPGVIHVGQPPEMSDFVGCNVLDVLLSGIRRARNIGERKVLVVERDIHVGQFAVQTVVTDASDRDNVGIDAC